MTKAIQKKVSESAFLRWSVLALVSFTMLTGYIVSDVMAPLKTMLEQTLSWDSSDYGIFTSGYGLINIFLLMLIFGGMILDKKGSRFTGILSVVVMLVGAVMKYWAFASDFGGSMTTLNIFGWQVFSVKAQVFWATLGFAIFGVGIEMIGITANKIVIKWFKGRSLALALGLNVAAGRIGTAIALLGSYPIAKAMGSPSAPMMLCVIALVIGLLAFLVFGVMDRRFDQETQEQTTVESNDEEEFRPSDIFKIARIRAFWYITILCVLFYSAVFPFLKYATELMMQKFNVSSDYAGIIPSLLPFGNILLTPIFGSIYDRKGRGATIMLIGSILLVVVHLLFAIPELQQNWVAIILMILLGASFSLVPSAMWPSVPKIVPERMLGTAYSMIFWIQNWGLAFVPVIIGFVLDKYCVTGTRMIDSQTAISYDYTLPMLMFAVLGAMSIIFALLLRKEDSKHNYGLEQPNIVKE
ncbi:MAG: MFS transporter [Rikenellaceae bacterium]